MTEETAPIESSSEAPAAAPTAVQPAEQAAVKKLGRGRGWWMLPSAAGVALLVIGLLSGILIGQTMHGPGHQGRTTQAFIERSQPGQQNQLPQRLKDHRFQQRQRNQQDQGNKQQPTPQPSVPSNGSNG